MKLMKRLCSVLAAALLVTACEKVDPLPFYNNGTTPAFTATTTTVAPPPADSLKNVITFSWTSPNYAADSATHRYIIEIDSAGRNFAKARQIVVIGARTKSFLGKEFNDILLGMGFNFGVTYDVDVRLISSYNNNNDRLVANTIKLKATPYKVPPKVALPASLRLFIVGNATDFDWTNPSSMPPVRELTRTSETVWEGIFNLSGGGAYLILPEAGNWGLKYAVTNNSVAGAANAGTFGFNLNDDFPGNVSGGGGWHRIRLDFQSGTYAVTRVANPLPDALYLTGDATASGWTNTPPESQKLNGITNGVWEKTITLQGGGKFMKILTGNGQWAPQFGGSSATGGDLGANYGSSGDPDAIPVNAAGSYKVQVNLLTNKYTVTKL